MKGCVVFTLSLSVFLFHDTDSANVPDPCPSDLPCRKNVVTMCEANAAYEEPGTGSSSVDSVVVRINKQEDNCICKARMQYYIQDLSPIYVRAYDQLPSAAPDSSICGLHIEMTSLSATGESNFAVVKCNDAVKKLKVNLARNGFLEFNTKKARGNFSYGYCLQIFRDSEENPSTLQIECYGQQTDQNANNSSTITTSSLPAKGEEDTTLYTAVGGGVGGFFVVLAVILIIVLKRKGVLSSSNKENNRHTTDNHASDVYDTYGLKDNVLYIPSNDTELNPSDYDSRVRDHSNSTSDLLYSSIDTVQQEKGVKSQQRESIRNDGNYSTKDSNFGYNENDSATSSVIGTTIDGEYSTVSLEKRGPDNLVNKKGMSDKKPKPSIKPKHHTNISFSNKKESVENDDVKGSNPNAVVYAVVNKGRSSVGLNHVTPMGSTEKYTVIHKIK